jgi:hypothetical protein
MMEYLLRIFPPNIYLKHYKLAPRRHGATGTPSSPPEMAPWGRRGLPTTGGCPPQKYLPPQKKKGGPGGAGVTRPPHLRARCCPGWPPCVRGPLSAGRGGYPAAALGRTLAAAAPPGLAPRRRSLEAAPRGPARPLDSKKGAAPDGPEGIYRVLNAAPGGPEQVMNAAPDGRPRPPAASGGSTPGRPSTPGATSLAVTRPSPLGKKKKSVWPPFKVQAAAWSRDGRPEGRSKLPTLR